MKNLNGRNFKYNLVKSLIFKIYEQLIELNSSKKNSVKKWAKDLNRHFCKDDTGVINSYVKRCSTSLIIKGIKRTR